MIGGVWRFKSGLKSIITISTRSIISRFKLRPTQSPPAGWWRHKKPNCRCQLERRGNDMNPMMISFENFLRRSLSFWVRKHPGSGWAGVSWGWLSVEAGDVWPSRGLSSLSSLLDRVTPRAQSEYNTPSAHYMLIPDPCSALSRALTVISLVTFIARGPLIGWCFQAMEHKSARNVSGCIQ